MELRWLRKGLLLILYGGCLVLPLACNRPNPGRTANEALQQKKMKPGCELGSSQKISRPQDSRNLTSLPISIGSCDHFNVPHITLTLCQPNGVECRKIANILVDTGSYGLRLYSQVLGEVLLPPLPDNLDAVLAPRRELAQCAAFGNSDHTWGGLFLGDIYLGQHRLAQNTVQIIGDRQAQTPANCDSSLTTPEEAGYNGILGIGPFTADCGSFCETNSDNLIYYSCPDPDQEGDCRSTSVGRTQQLGNPLSRSSSFEGRYAIVFPDVATDNTDRLTGELVLDPQRIDEMAARSTQYVDMNAQGLFRTYLNEKEFVNSWLDSGSAVTFVPRNSLSLPFCSLETSEARYFCPGQRVALTAEVRGQSSLSRFPAEISIINATEIFSVWTSNYVTKSTVGVYNSDFIWGLPFFMGREVIFLIEDLTANQQLGPGFWF